MKKLLFKTLIITSVIAGLLITQAFTSPYSQKEISLKDAISNNTVSAQITSNGDYSGNSIILSITNNTRANLNIKIPAGTLYHPEEDEEQTLIQLEDEFIVLSPKETYNGELAAYCTESDDRCPTEDGTMKMASTERKEFIDFLEYLKGKNFDESTFQDAVWAISDGHSISHIVAEEEEEKELRSYVAELTDQDDTWYTSPRNVQVDESGNFNYETVNIEGDLEFDCTRGAKVRQDIYKANGEAMFISEKFLVINSTHASYWFKAHVTGWEKGEYFIKIHDGVNEIARFPFTV